MPSRLRGGTELLDAITLGNRRYSPAAGGISREAAGGRNDSHIEPSVARTACRLYRWPVPQLSGLQMSTDPRHDSRCLSPLQRTEPAFLGWLRPQVRLAVERDDCCHSEH